MATTYVTMANLTRYDSNLKTYIDSNKTKSLKSLSVADNKINFYCDAAPAEGAVADFTVDFPTEFFLDQTKTVFVENFEWTEAAYPGSTNPNLDGKGVLVLAVKGDDGSVNYSFINVERLVNIYDFTAGQGIEIDVHPTDPYQMQFNVEISQKANNLLTAEEDGLYVATPEAVDISGKADKLSSGLIAQILVDDGNGNIAASGKTIADVIAEVNAEFVEMTDDEIDNLFA